MPKDKGRRKRGAVPSVDSGMTPRRQLRPVPSDTRSVRERIEEAAREIGLLLMAFAPLDTAVGAAQGQKTGSTLFSALVGLCLFVGAMAMEQRRRGGE